MPVDMKAYGTGQGTPLPGGGCFYQTPDGNTTNRLDVNCDGTPTTAALAARERNAYGGGDGGAGGGGGPFPGGGFPGGGGGGADPHGQKIRQLSAASRPGANAHKPSYKHFSPRNYQV